MDAADATVSERLALIASDRALASVDARAEDLADPDVRAVVIRADHPELDRALRDGRDEIKVNGEPVSIRLHLQMHQVLATQTGRRRPARGVCDRPAAAGGRL